MSDFTDYLIDGPDRPFKPKRRRPRAWSKRHIFKVQLPIVTSDPVPKALVYNKDRSIEYWAPLTAKMRHQLGHELKRFWYGRLVGTVIHLDSPAPWQNW